MFSKHPKIAKRWSREAEVDPQVEAAALKLARDGKPKTKLPPRKKGH